MIAFQVSPNLGSMKEIQKLRCLSELISEGAQID